MKINKQISHVIFFLLVIIVSVVHAEDNALKSDVLKSGYNLHVIDYGQIVYGILIVMFILFAAIILVKRTRLNNIGNQNGIIEVINCHPVTTKDKLLVIRAGKEYLLIGVSSNSINKIHSLNTDAVEEFINSNKKNLHNFSSIYASTIGKIHNA